MANPVTNPVTSPVPSQVTPSLPRSRRFVVLLTLAAVALAAGAVWLTVRDGSLPLGPGLTPAWLVPDPHDLRIRLWVNDELQQDGSTADMVCDIPALVAAASQAVTLEPGDVISTGTPAGVGAGRGASLRPGDVVRTEIEQLGVLVNRIVAANPPPLPRTPSRPRLEEP